MSRSDTKNDANGTHFKDNETNYNLLYINTIIDNI